jgi:hypothetical protein
LVTGGIPVERGQPPNALTRAGGHLYVDRIIGQKPANMAVSNLSVTASEFRATLDELNITSRHVARWCGVGPRSVRRWQDGTRHIPCGVDLVLRLLAAGTVTVAQVEQVAVPSPDATPEPLVPLLVEPAPEQSALMQAAPLVDTAQKVVALTPEACRWPYGDPECPDFHFCGSSVAKRPYCEKHYARAHAVLPTGGGHGAARPSTHFFRYRRAGPSVLARERADDGKTRLWKDATVAGEQRELGPNLGG